MNQGKIVKVSEHYTVERLRNRAGASTRIEYRNDPGARFSSSHITVTSNVDWALNSEGKFSDEALGWKKAHISWAALGVVTPAEAKEFAAALDWAVEEAARMDEINAMLPPYKFQEQAV